MEKETVYCETTGCAANQARGSVIKGKLENSAFKLLDSPEEADIIVLNTCAIKRPTQDKLLHRVREFHKQEKKLIVTGCLPVILKKQILSVAPTASLLGPHSLDKIVKAVKKATKSEKIMDLESRPTDYLLEPRKIDGLCATVPIAKGCVGSCTYCVDKIVFSELVSFPKQKIIREIKRLISEGVKEIRLSGQDTGPWGKDRNSDLSILLKTISTLKANFQIRLGMASPDTFQNVSDQVLTIMKGDKRFYRFFHLPVQSGSNYILDKMNRNYTRTDFMKLIEKIRKQFNKPTIVTDVIVGFPGETKSDFNKTKQLLKEIRPESVNLSRYYDRPSVPSTQMDGHLSSNVKQARSKEIAQLTNTISREKNSKKEGEIVNCLLLTEDKRYDRYLGRTRDYTKVAVPQENSISLGRWHKVKVTDSTARTLYGRTI